LVVIEKKTIVAGIVLKFRITSLSKWSPDGRLFVSLKYKIDIAIVLISKRAIRLMLFVCDNSRIFREDRAEQ
jgi:hypothetical protein